MVAQGNGNSNDTTNLDNTALRGIQFSDENGVLQFTGVYPGHYDGRSHHIHGRLIHLPASNNWWANQVREEAATSDPVLNYVLIDNTVASGIFGWVTVGINPTVSKTVRPAGHYDGPN